MKNNYFTITDDAKTLTSEIFNECKKHFLIYSYWNDKELDKNFPPPKESTTRDFKKEGESNNKGLSWNTFVKEQKHEVMTLREYALAQIQYFKKTGKFLDQKGYTIFSDVLSGGRVACGRYHPNYDWVWFDWDSPGNEYDFMGFREAISLNPSSKPKLKLPKNFGKVNGLTFSGCSYCGGNMGDGDTKVCNHKPNKKCPCYELGYETALNKMVQEDAEKIIQSRLK